MNDLPSHLLQQQELAKPITGLELETFGKHAASLYKRRSYPTVQEAVVATIKTAALSPEQVRRVVEFANTEAYLLEIQKEAQHRYVELQGGPASPADVLRELNDGGSPTVLSKASHHYQMAPPDVEKLAASNLSRLDAPDALTYALHSGGQRYPSPDPLSDSTYLRTQLAGLHDNLMSKLSSLEVQYLNAEEELVEQVKKAMSQALTLGDVLYAVSSLPQTIELTKCAFSTIREGLVKNLGGEKLAQSMTTCTKRLSVVNEEHPLLSAYSNYCTTLEKLAHTRAAAEEVKGHLDTMTTFTIQADKVQRGLVKESSLAYDAGNLLRLTGEVLGEGWRGVKSLAASSGQELATGLGGGSKAQLAGKVVEHAPTAALLTAGGLGAEAAHERLQYGQGRIPEAYRSAKDYLTGALIPTSEAGLRRRYMVQQ